MPTASHDTTAGDAAFAQTLSRIAHDVAPAIDVDTTHVVPTARRRRDRRRSFVTASLGVVFLAGVGISQAPTWGTAPAVVADPVVANPAVTDPARIAPMSVDPGSGAEPAGDVVLLAEPTADDALLPTPAAVTLGVAGAGALGVGAWFAVRARRRG